MVAIKKNARVLTGVVVNDVADKTVSVMVVRQYRHSLYKKIIKERQKYLAHDKNNEFKKGDLVKIQECAPISKRKTWFVKEKIDTQRS